MTTRCSGRPALSVVVTSTSPGMAPEAAPRLSSSSMPPARSPRRSKSGPLSSMLTGEPVAGPVASLSISTDAPVNEPMALRTRCKVVMDDSERSP